MVIKTLPRESCAAKSPGYHGIYWMNVKPYKIWMDEVGKSYRGDWDTNNMCSDPCETWWKWKLLHSPVGGRRKLFLQAQNHRGRRSADLAVLVQSWLSNHVDGYTHAQMVTSPTLVVTESPKWLAMLNTQHELYVHDGWFCHYIMIGSVVACKCVAQC